MGLIHVQKERLPIHMAIGYVGTLLEREVKSGKCDDYRSYDGKHDSPERKPHGKSGYRPIAVVWLLVFLFFVHSFIHSFAPHRDFTTGNPCFSPSVRSGIAVCAAQIERIGNKKPAEAGLNLGDKFSA
jgi:hypothetical protein